MTTCIYDQPCTAFFHKYSIPIHTENIINVDTAGHNLNKTESVCITFTCMCLQDRQGLHTFFHPWRTVTDRKTCITQ